MAESSDTGRRDDAPRPEQAIVESRARVADVPDLWRGGFHPDYGMPAPTGGLAAYWHSFRRRWLAAILLGLAVAGAAAPAVWFTYRPQYTATAAFHVASSLAPILPGGGDRMATAFEVYKGTQQQYVKSRFVLVAALRKPEAASATVLQDELDPVDWLQQNLKVSFPGNAEIMTISLTTADPRESAALVNAVVEAYRAEVVDVELNQRRQRLNDLERIYTEKENELRAKRSDLKRLAEQLGAGEKENLSLRQQIALQQFAAFRSELINTQFKVMRLRWELKAKEAEAQRPATVEVTDVELEQFLRTDPVAIQLLQRDSELRQRRQEAQSVLTWRGSAEHLERSRGAEESTQRALAARRVELREELKRRKRAALQASIDQLKAEIAAGAEQEKQLLADAEQAKKLAESFGGSSIDVEMMRSEIALLEGLLKSVADEREKLNIEIRNRPRITLMHRADPPAAPDRDRKPQLTVLAGLGGFFLPFLGIIWLDARSRRINSSGEVYAHTGLDVIGALPLVPARSFRSLVGASGRLQRARQELNESIDGIAARLLHLAQRDQTRVVLVSSAVAGEGKTTLATQLALSLARTGHQTVLVDFDLRQPAIDQVFAVPLEPGVAEILRDGVKLHEALQNTEIDGLVVLPAGRGDRRLLVSLANGAVQGLFDQLRQEFDFVIVDASPILPVPDTRFLAKHVDGVVLSVLRDVSSVPNILSACEVLAGFGVRPLGAVVTGPVGGPFYRSPYMPPVM